MWPIFIANIINYYDISPPGYIECDFDADFILKLQIPILCYCLKKGIKYHIKTFWGTNFGIRRVFSQIMDTLYLYMLCQNQVWHFPIFVKKCNIEFELNLCSGSKFSFQEIWNFNFICQMASNSPEYSYSNHSKLACSLCTEFCTPLYFAKKNSLLIVSCSTWSYETDWDHWMLRIKFDWFLLISFHRIKYDVTFFRLCYIITQQIFVAF